MEFSDIVAITGMPGLYKTVAKRQDGMIVSALGEEKSKFVSARIHMFTPLENITIYTIEDSVTLKEVFRSMKDTMSDNAVPEPNSSNDALKTYFENVLPDYDQDKVYVSDIKKVIKWFKAIESHNMLTDELLADTENSENYEADESVAESDTIEKGEE